MTNIRIRIIRVIFWLYWDNGESNGKEHGMKAGVISSKLGMCEGMGECCFPGSSLVSPNYVQLCMFFGVPGPHR